MKKYILIMIVLSILIPISFASATTFTEKLQSLISAIMVQVRALQARLFQQQEQGIINVNEWVQCVFENSNSKQKCYTNNSKFSCESSAPTTPCRASSSECLYKPGSCSVNVSGKKGTKLTWKSSCSGANTTYIDGNVETITFKCPVKAPLTCTDSDGGKNYYTFGKVINTENIESVDACGDDNMLVEFFCANNTYEGKERYKCPNGCSKGACIQ